MGFNTSFPWNQVNTLVQDAVDNVIRPQWNVSNAVYYRMGRRKKTFTGGRRIVIPLNWRANAGAGWFSGNKKLDTTYRDEIQAAEFTPKNAYVPIPIFWEDQMVVRGPEEVKDLTSSKLEIARNSIIDLIGTDMYNLGTDAERITGLRFSLQAFTSTAPGVLAAQTYGGISRQGRYDGSGGGTQTNNWWIHQGDNTAYSTAAAGNFDPLTAGKVHGVLGKMWAKIGIASGKTPTMILSNWGSYTAYHNALVFNERFGRPQQNSDLAKSGFENVMYRSAAWVWDERAPRDSSSIESIYFINENTVTLRVASGVDMKYVPFRDAQDQMTQVAYILWRGELIIVEPRANGVISSVDTSAVS